jgi:hypothetical protein
MTVLRTKRKPYLGLKGKWLTFWITVSNSTPTGVLMGQAFTHDGGIGGLRNGYELVWL